MTKLKKKHLVGAAALVVGGIYLLGRSHAAAPSDEDEADIFDSDNVVSNTFRGLTGVDLSKVGEGIGGFVFKVLN